MSGPGRNHVIVGDARRELRRLPDSSVDMVLTSPPYFRLRDYQISDQLGMEDDVRRWVERLRLVAAEIDRVLTPTGTFWLNVGDTFSTHRRQGAARKGLLLAPERLALALTEDGWILRNKVVWAKSNHMPTSVADRLGCSWEVVYLFAHRPRYYFDLHAIRMPHSSRPRPPKRPPTDYEHEQWRGPNGDTVTGLAALKAAGLVGHPLGKNPGDVWTIGAGNYRGGHHAVFPIALARRAIQAGCPEARCPQCRLPWQRHVVSTADGTAALGPLAATCDCHAGREAGLVLDPFFGAGTTGLAAEQYGRDWLGIELNPDFAALAVERIASARPIPAAHPPPAA